MYILMKKKLIIFWPILMMFYVKSRFFIFFILKNFIFIFIARGVQLDNRVNPPGWKCLLECQDWSPAIFLLMKCSHCILWREIFAEAFNVTSVNLAEHLVVKVPPQKTSLTVKMAFDRGWRLQYWTQFRTNRETNTFFSIFTVYDRFLIKVIPCTIGMAFNFLLATWTFCKYENLVE